MLVLMILIISVIGCSYGQERVELMLDNPPGVLEDSLYADTEEKLEALESQYLSQQIPYAEYMEKKGELDGRYQREVDRRSAIVEGN